VKPHEALQAEVEAMLKPGMAVAFATDATTYDASEFDMAAQLDLAARCGFNSETAHERATRA